MADRKVLIKYYPPDFNPERLIRNPKQTDKQDHVRMMLPFSLKCYTCGNYLYIGTKFNMRKETCEEDYLGIPILRFYMKCTYCYSEITITTDPKNHDYICENGGSRNYEAWRDARAAEHTLIEMREDEEKGNAMKFLENRTKTSKREMDILDALDEMRNMSRQNAKIDTDQLFEYINKRDSADIQQDNEEEIKELMKVKRIKAFNQTEESLKTPKEGLEEIKSFSSTGDQERSSKPAFTGYIKKKSSNKVQFEAEKPQPTIKNNSTNSLLCNYSEEDL